MRRGGFHKPAPDYRDRIRNGDPSIDGVKEGLESKRADNREILDLQVIPEHLVVIGGGVIGLEMAGYFRTCGSQVTVVEMLDHIAGAADREMADLLQRLREERHRVSLELSGDQYQTRLG